MFYNNIQESAMGNMAELGLDESKVTESIYNDFNEGSLVAMAENEANYNKLIEGIGLMESAMFAESGEVVYTEGVVSNVVNSVKKFLTKVWEKIKALFKRFVAMFDKFFLNDKDFLKKYETQVREASGYAKDLEFKGYKFTNLDAAVKKLISNNPMEKAKTLANTIQTKGASVNVDADAKEKCIDEIRGTACGAGSSVEAGDFEEKLKEYLYGSASAEDVEISVDAQIGVLKNTKGDIDGVKKLEAKIDKAFSDAIKALDKKTSEAMNSKDDSDKNTTASSNTQLIEILRAGSQITTRSVGMTLNALRDRNRQARAICVRLISKAGKKNEAASVEEGFQYSAYGDSFLSDIQFK